MTQPSDRCPTVDVTVVICALDVADVLPRQLDRVTEQIDAVHRDGRSRIEVVCVDNGSSDGTRIVLDRYRQRHDYLRVVSEPRRGVSRARNAAVVNAAGDRVIMVDADDEVLDGWLTAMVAALDHADIVGCHFDIIDPPGHESDDMPQPGSPQMWGLASPWGGGCGFSIDTWNAVGGFATDLESGGEDTDFFLRAQILGSRVAWVERPLVRYHRWTTPDKVRRRAVGEVVAGSHTYWFGRVRGWPRRPGIVRSLLWPVARSPRALTDRDFRADWVSETRAIVVRVRSAVRFGPAMALRAVRGGEFALAVPGDRRPGDRRGVDRVTART